MAIGACINDWATSRRLRSRRERALKFSSAMSGAWRLPQRKKGHLPRLKQSCGAPLHRPLMNAVAQSVFVGLLLCLGLSNTIARAGMSLPSVLSESPVVRTRASNRICWRQCGRWCAGVHRDRLPPSGRRTVRVHLSPTHERTCRRPLRIPRSHRVPLRRRTQAILRLLPTCQRLYRPRPSLHPRPLLRRPCRSILKRRIRRPVIRRQLRTLPPHIR
jgi:hypothetical protein